jgi:hypothetical protein
MSSTAVETTTRDQVERILHSAPFRNSDALRRLFSYLVDKTLAGEADQLKEYTIGLDAFGKPPTYDPQHDSIVRLQVSRLRQKLSEYYRTEGVIDTVLVDIPKGQFKLSFEHRVHDAPLSPEHLDGTGRTAVIALSAALLLAIGWGVYASVHWMRAAQGSALAEAAWTPDLEELWAPFLSTPRPLMISAAAPLFVNLGTNRMYRDLAINRWEDAIGSQSLADVRKVLQNPEMRPRYHYAPVSEVNAAFLLGKLLGTRKQQMFLAKSNQLSWQQYADNNMVFIGPPAVYDEALRSMPVRQEFVLGRSGLQSLHPAAGEPAFFKDAMSPGTSEDGEVYALITHTPGPLGNGEVVSFTCNTTPACLGAVQVFTDAALARSVVDKLKGSKATIPSYYQIVLKVTFRDTVPVETSYVTHRPLLMTAPRSP